MQCEIKEQPVQGIPSVEWSAVVIATGQKHGKFGTGQVPN